jgi:prolyl 4-hydroxylase
MLSDRDYYILYKALLEYTLNTNLTDELKQDLKNLHYKLSNTENLDDKSQKVVMETYHKVQSLTPLSSDVNLAIEKIPLRPYIYKIPKIFTPEECNSIIEVAKPKLHPSTVISRKEKLKSSKRDEISDQRTSSNTFLSLNDSDDELFKFTMSKFDAIVRTLTGLPSENKEEMQVVHYDVGQFYESHMDTFQENTASYKEECEDRGGQRVYSIMLYLNNVEEGGETEFPKVGLKVKPEIGTVLFWHDMVDGVPYLKSEHGGMAPIKGEKWACTYWIREQTFNQKVIKE